MSNVHVCSLNSIRLMLFTNTSPLCQLTTRHVVFYVLFTVHPGIKVVNNQLDTQFFLYVYFYSLHVSGSHVPIVRRIIASMRHLVYVTVWYAGAYASAYQTVIYTE